MAAPIFGEAMPLIALIPSGKTNVLEAVSLLTPGRGLRQVPIAEMARSDGPGGFAVAARLDDHRPLCRTPDSTA